MNQPLHISNYCIIRNNKVFADNNLLFEREGVEPADFLRFAYKHFKTGYPKFYKMDNLSKLGFIAVEILLKGRDLNLQYGKDKTGIVFANSASSLDTDRNYQESIADRKNYFPSPAVFVYTLPNIVMGEISIRHKMHGESIFFIQEKFNVDFIRFYISQLFEQGIVSCCITGWIDVDAGCFEAVLYLVEKTDQLNDGIAIFDDDNIERIYCMKI